MDSTSPVQGNTIRFSYNGVPGSVVVSPTNRGSVNLKSIFDEKGKENPIQSTVQNYFISGENKVKSSLNEEQQPRKLESGAPIVSSSGENQILKLEGGNEPSIYKSYKKSETRTQKYEVEDIPDAREEDFRSGCCGKTPVTYESEEK